MSGNQGNTLSADQCEVLDAFSKALQRETHNLKENPELLWQQMYNRLQWEGDAVLEELKPALQERSRADARPWFRCDTPFRESQSLLRTIQTPSEKIFSCTFSPEGDSILVGDEDGVIRIFQTSTGKQVHTIEVKDNVNAYHFSPNGLTIKTICQDGLIQVWETASGKQLSTFNILPDIEVSAFSQDGHLLLTYHKDKTLILWNVETGEYLSVLANEAGNVEACSFSPNGQLIATIGSQVGLGFQLRVWSVVTREQLYCVDSRSGFHTCNFSPDGQLLVTDYTIWDVKTGQEAHTLSWHDKFVSHCVFSPDGRFVASAGFSDETVRIWNVETGQLFCTLTGHTSAVMACAFSPDGQFVLSASMDKTLRLWTIPGEPMQEAEEDNSGGVLSCGFSPDGNLIAAGFGHGELLLIDAATDETLHAIDITSDPVTCCTFSPDSQYIAYAGQDWVMEVRDTQTGEEIITFDLDADTKTLNCDFSPDGKYLIASTKGFEILVWDFISKEEDVLRKFEAHDGQVNCCKFSPDGQWIASGDWDSNLLIWNLKTGHILHKLIGQTVSVFCCSFSPDGKHIISGNSDGSVKIWAMDSGDLIQSIEAHAINVSECVFSPDGSFIFSSGEDTFLKVFDAKSFNLLTQFPFAGQLVSFGLHPFKPKLVCGDHFGVMYKVELMGIAYQPIFVTPVTSNNHLLVRCPACLQEHKIEKAQLGKTLTCHSPDCGLLLRINTFILGGEIEQVQAIATSDDIDWLRDQVRTHQEKGDLETALEAADRILELQKNDAIASHARLAILVQMGRYDEAIKTGDRYIQLNIVDRSNPAEIYLLMGMAFAGNEKFGPQRFDSALTWLQNSLLVQETSQAWLQHGMALANLGKPESALESYLKARALQTESEKYQIDLAIGFNQLHLENVSAAEVEFRTTLAHGNKDPLAYFGLGLSLVLSGKADQSVQWFKDFLRNAGPEHQEYVSQAKLIVEKLRG